MLRLVLASVAVLIFAPVSSASAGCDAIPEVVSAYLQTAPGWVLLTDMHNADDQRDWDQRHPALCPGIAAGNFYGDGPQAYAIALIQASGSETKEKIVVVRRLGARLSVQSLVPVFEMHIPLVVIAMPPGIYEDAWKTRRVLLRRDSILNAQWEAGADLYYFLRGKFRKLAYEI